MWREGRRSLREWLVRLKDTFYPGRSDEDLEAELRSHLELAEDEVRRGAAPGELDAARRHARMTAGGLSQASARFRDQRGLPWLSDFVRDLRYAVRMVGRQPGFTAIAAVSLAFGIGANTAAFSWADAILLRPLPVPQPSTVLTIGVPATDPGEPLGASYREYVDLRAQVSSFDGLLAFAESDGALVPRSDAPPQPSLGLLVSDNFFDVLGLAPAHGRWFRPEEAETPGREPVIVLGYDAWVRRFAGDPDVLGRVVGLNGVALTVIGVAPAGFNGLDLFNRYEFYAPLSMWPRLRNGLPENVFESRDQRRLSMRGRLKPDRTIASARAELSSIGSDFARVYPETNRDTTFVVRTEIENRMIESPGNVTLAMLLAVLALAVLLTACANVSGLIANRIPVRAREISVRLAIGASRSHVIRQLLTEQIVIAAGGCAGGLAVGYAAISVFRRFRIPTDLPISVAFELDRRALLVCLSFAVVSTLLVGLVPALRAGRMDLSAAMKSAAPGAVMRRRRLAGAWVVGVQVALAVVLLTVATLMVQDLRGRLARGPGFETGSRLMMWFNPDMVGTGPEQAQAFYAELARSVRDLPGVRAATVSSLIPTDGGASRLRVFPEGVTLPDPDEGAETFAASVDESYFETLGVPLVEGRAFHADDAADAPRVAIVNEVVAATYWPGRSPIGRRIRVGDQTGPWVEVVGVAKTGQYFFLIEPPEPLVYFPRSQRPLARMALVIHAAGPPEALAAPVRELVRRLDGRQPIYNLRTVGEQYRMRAVVILEILMTLVTAMGAMGLGLALVGLFGLVTYGVARRTREIGIRVAIGARPRDVLRMAIAEGAAITAAGLVTGVVVGLLAGRTIAAALPGAADRNGTDLLVFAGVVCTTLAITLLAAYVPARRALRVMPTEALRCE
jgi:predicted permease